VFYLAADLRMAISVFGEDMIGSTPIFMQRCKKGEMEIIVRWGGILNISTFHGKTDLSILLYSPSLLLPGSPLLHSLNDPVFSE